jgi:hypothetical protein
LPIETFDATDENGARAKGTVEVYRDPKGPFYDPNSEFYQHPRYADRNIKYLNTRDLCRIDRSVLSNAVQGAFRGALIKLGIPDPHEDAIKADVEKSITEMLRECTPMSEAAPPGALPGPPASIPYPVADQIQGVQQQSADQAQSSIRGAGASSFPFVPESQLAPAGYLPVGDNPFQDQTSIRRLTRVRPA